MLENAIFHHIGTAVKSIEKVKSIYLSMGYTVTGTVIEPVQKVYVAYAKKKVFLQSRCLNHWMTLRL